MHENTLFDDLFRCYFSNDEVVRLRTSNAIKRICQAEKRLVIPYIDRFLTEVSTINQASTQWTLAQVFGLLADDLTPVQTQKATDIMKNNLENHQDWIVLNTTMDTLGRWSLQEASLKSWLIPHLERLAKDSRKSVANKAGKIRAQLDKNN